MIARALRAAGRRSADRSPPMPSPMTTAPSTRPTSTPWPTPSVILGQPDGNFNPDGDVTRAQVASMVARAYLVAAGTDAGGGARRIHRRRRVGARSGHRRGGRWPAGSTESVAASSTRMATPPAPSSHRSSPGCCRRLSMTDWQPSRRSRASKRGRARSLARPLFSFGPPLSVWVAIAEAQASLGRSTLRAAAYQPCRRDSA